MTDMHTFIEKYRRLLPIGTSLSTSEYEKRAAMFLEVMAMIADWKHEFTKTRIQQLSTQTATYAEELGKGTAKTVTENKTVAEASKVYTSAREDLENTENDISYLKTYYEIFNQAHLLYRQMSKGEFGGG